jgi:hypothetical protein
LGFILTIGIRLWWCLKTAVKLALFGKTSETISRQEQNKYVISGQITGLYRLGKKLWTE